MPLDGAGDGAILGGGYGAEQVTVHPIAPSVPEAPLSPPPVALQTPIGNFLGLTCSMSFLDICPFRGFENKNSTNKAPDHGHW